MKYQKGQSGNPAGRPVGSPNKDRQNYLDCQLWFKKALEELETLEKPELRVNLILSTMDKLMAKVANLPKSPEESVENANVMVEAMKAMENGANSGTETAGG